MGKLGTANIKQIVDNTTRRGVNKLRDIQNNYTDKTFSNSTNGQENFYQPMQNGINWINWVVVNLEEIQE